MDTTTPSHRHNRSSFLLVTLVAVLVGPATFVLRGEAAPAPTTKDAADEPKENPLRNADEATRQRALTEAWTTYQLSCQTCHGGIGGGDGPHANFGGIRASDLRRAGRAAIGDATRFRRIRDGAAALPERPWDSSMPAFGDDLDAQQIWGLVLLLEQLAKSEAGVPADADAAAVYETRCAVCHGSGGAGDGPLAAELWPRPSNLARGEYRLRSTTFGSAPIDSDVIGSIAKGLNGTPMGAFTALGAQRLEDLAAHLRTFAPERFAAEPEVPLGANAPAQASSQLAERGRVVYQEAKCAECHGPEGRGNGPSAATLKNDDGQPTVATNLTKRAHFKSGGTANENYKLLSTGMNGTPMRGYADTLSADDRWALSYYLDKIGRVQRKPVPAFARNVSGDIPSDPTDTIWGSIPRSIVELGPQMELRPYWAPAFVDMVEMSAAVSERQLAVLLVWDDPTRDVQAADVGGERTVAATLARTGSWRLPDQIALQWPVKIEAGTRPAPFLGDAKHPIERWRWSADRQEQGDKDAIVERAEGPKAVTPRTDGPPVRVTATYADGQWRALFVADRPKANVLPVAIHGWDGARGESGTLQSFSAWVEIRLD